MSETYALTINCRQCGYQFDAEIPFGREVERAKPYMGTAMSWKDKKYHRHEIECPHCGSIDCYRDRATWPWREGTAPTPGPVEEFGEGIFQDVLALLDKWELVAEGKITFEDIMQGGQLLCILSLLDDRDLHDAIAHKAQPRDTIAIYRKRKTMDNPEPRYCPRCGSEEHWESECPHCGEG